MSKQQSSSSIMKGIPSTQNSFSLNNGNSNRPSSQVLNAIDPNVNDK